MKVLARFALLLAALAVLIALAGVAGGSLYLMLR
jgi:hypothetical protein